MGRGIHHLICLRLHSLINLCLNRGPIGRNGRNYFSSTLHRTVAPRTVSLRLLWSRGRGPHSYTLPQTTWCLVGTLLSLVVKTEDQLLFARGGGGVWWKLSLWESRSSKEQKQQLPALNLTWFSLWVYEMPFGDCQEQGGWSSWKGQSPEWAEGEGRVERACNHFVYCATVCLYYLCSHRQLRSGISCFICSSPDP